MMLRNSFLFLMLITVCMRSGAQQTNYRAELDAVPRDGFYRIVLSPEATANSRADLADIRLKDGRGKTVPYLVEPARGFTSSPMDTFPVLSAQTAGRFTTIVLDVHSAGTLNELVLVMANTAVVRHLSLSGSRDGSSWYIINDSLPLEPSQEWQRDQYLQWLQFPQVRYAFLKLVIDNRNTEPLLVLHAGKFRNPLPPEPLRWQQNPPPLIRQVDSSDHTSYIFLENMAAFPVDAILMDLAGPKFFRRPVTIYEGWETRTRSAMGFVRSGTPARILLPSVKSKRLLIAIENGDDQPLQINAVTTEQQLRSLVAYLQQGRGHQLLTGDPDAKAPVYDIARFRDSIPAQLPELEHGRFIATAGSMMDGKGPGMTWIWAALVLMVLVLGYLSLRMLKDIRR